MSQTQPNQTLDELASEVRMLREEINKRNQSVQEAINAWREAQKEFDRRCHTSLPQLKKGSQQKNKMTTLLLSIFYLGTLCILLKLLRW